MPPKRCPECGRFLANDLVSSLAEAPAPCPRCGAQLRPDTIVGGDRDRRARPVRAARPARADAEAAERREPDAGEPPADSIRPPDLDPAAVRTGDDDVLAGWDPGASAREIASWRVDERPFPTDAVVVASVALVGGLLGALLPEQQRGRWAALGALGGAVGAGAARRIWELRG